MSEYDGQPRDAAPRTWRRVAVIGLLLPLVAASVLIWSASGREAHLDKVPVAIVNDDTIISSPQPMAAGRSLTAALTHPKSGTTNLQWTLTDKAHATDGLANGTYYAVLTIPSDFSKAILSTGTDKPAQGKLTLVSNGAASSTVPYLSHQIAAAAATSLGDQATQGYLGNVYDGFNQIAKSQDQAASSASQLADGTAQLATGATQLDEGAGELADSLGQVAAGSEKLATGTASVYSGAVEVRDGVAQVAAGARELHGGEAALARGTRTLARSGDRVAVGARGVSIGTRGVSRGVAGLGRATSGLSTRLDALSRGCSAAGGSKAFCDRLRVDSAGARLIARGASALAGPAGRTADGAGTVASGSAEVARGASRVADQTQRLSTASGTLASSADRLSAGAANVAAGSAGVDSAAGQLAGGTRSTSTAGGSLADASLQLASSAGQADSGAQQLSSGLAKGAKEVPTYSSTQQKALTPVVSQPVDLTASVQHTAHGNGWLIALILGSVLWLAGLVAALSRDLSGVVRDALAPVSSRRLAWAQALPLLGLAALQVAAVLVALVVFHPSTAALVPLVALTLVAGLTFTLLALALRLALGRVGVTLFLLFLVFQLAASGNVVPLETAPAVLRTLNGVMPLTAYVNGASQLVSGGHVSAYLGVLLVVLLWGLGSAAALVRVVKRRREPLPVPVPVLVPSA